MTQAFLSSLVCPLKLLSAYGWQCAMKVPPRDPLFPRAGMDYLFEPLVDRAIPLLRILELREKMTALSTSAPAPEFSSLASEVYQRLLVLWGFSVAVRDLGRQASYKNVLDELSLLFCKADESRYTGPLLDYGYGAEAVTLSATYARLPRFLRYLVSEETGDAS